MTPERALLLAAGLGLAGGGLYLWKRRKAPSEAAAPAKTLPAAAVAAEPVKALPAPTVAPAEPAAQPKPVYMAKPGVYQSPPTQAPPPVSAAPRQTPKTPAVRLSFNLR